MDAETGSTSMGFKNLCNYLQKFNIKLITLLVLKICASIHAQNLSFNLTLKGQFCILSLC